MGDNYLPKTNRKLTANIMVSAEKLETFHKNMKQDKDAFLSVLLNIVLEVLPNAIRKNKKEE